MVFFSCNNCGEASKKNQVERHLFVCRYATFSCMDCQLVFTRDNYKLHIKCISENQKYGGKDYVEKENKGELKQEAWVDQVNRAIEYVTDSEVKELLKNVAGFANIPRKETKFINFLMNSFRLRDKSLALRGWQAIAAEAEKMRQEALKKQEELQNALKAKKEEKEAEQKVEEPTETAQEEEAQKDEKDGAEETEEAPVTQFKWRKAIKRTLKDNGGEMKIKKLRKAVLDELLEVTGEEIENVEEIFNEKLAKCSVQVDGKKVSLV